MKHRYLAFILAIVMVFGLMLSACGGDAAETTAPSDDKNLSLGVIEGTTYRSEYAGIQINLDETWTIYPADQLQELPDVVGEAFEGTELEEAMEDAEQITDILAENMDELVTINLLLQKVSITDRMAYLLMTEDKIMDAMLGQKDTMLQAYAQAGINASSLEKVKVTYLGEERYALKTVADIEGVPYYVLQLFDYSQGAYSVTLTVGSFIDDKTEAVLDIVTPLE